MISGGAVGCNALFNKTYSVGEQQFSLRGWSGAAVSATSTDRPVFRRQRPYRCTAANWRLGQSTLMSLVKR
jgi:hypothetical protein